MSCAEPRKGVPIFGDVIGDAMEEPTRVIFFPDPAMPCKAYLRGEECTRKNCVYAHTETSLAQLIREIRSAKKSLDICVFTITCDKISDEVKDVAKRGVPVRIICDDEQAGSKGSDMRSLSKVDGITVRHDGDVESNMHHKFALVDGATLLNGSFVSLLHHGLPTRPSLMAVSPILALQLTLVFSPPLSLSPSLHLLVPCPDDRRTGPKRR